MELLDLTVSYWTSALQVNIRSSDSDRTLQSAAAFSAGMFPPFTEAVWNENLGKTWRPVSIHTVPISQENLLVIKAHCPEYGRLKDESYNLPEAKRLYREYKVRRKVSCLIGVTICLTV